MQPSSSSGGESPADTRLKFESRFDELLKRLHDEHETELGVLRQQLEERLKDVQTELLDTQRRLDNMQCQTGTAQDSQQLHDQNRGNQTPLEQWAAPSGDNTMADFEHNGVEADLGLKRTSSMLTVSGQPEDILKEKQSVMEDELEEIRKWAGRPKVKKHFTSSSVSATNNKLQKRLLFVVSHQVFEVICAAAILSNAAIMGAQIDYVARHTISPDAAPFFYRTMDNIYCVWFILELCLRMAAFRASFFYMQGWTWNLFDLTVVSTDAIQYVIEWVADSRGTLSNLTFLRMLRVLRISRAIRVVRLVRFFRDLRLMIASVMKSGTSLMWSMVLFCVIIYIFSIFLLNAVAFHLQESKNEEHYDNYRHYWSSLPQGMWTLFSCMTGGVSWMEVGEPLTNISWIYGVVLGFFMFFTIFVVTNIITGIFVDTAIQNAASDRDEVVQEELHCRDSARMQLKRVFDEADLDKSGKLTIEEFEEHLHDERVKAHLDSIGLHVDEARALFRLLDVHQTHEISIEEFLFGCMRLKGGATSIDLANLMYENKKSMQVYSKCHKEMMEAVVALEQKLDMFDRREEAEQQKIEQDLQFVMAEEIGRDSGLVLTHL